VAAEKLRAGRDFDVARENSPWTRYGASPELHAELRRYVLRPFAVFVSEACKLGRKGIWHVDRIHGEALEFLRLSTIDATYSKGYDKADRRFAQDWIDHSCGAIEPEVKRQLERSAEWQQFQEALLQVAESQVTRDPTVDRYVKDKTGTVTRDSAQSQLTSEPGAERDLWQKSYSTCLGRNLDVLRLESGWSFDEMAVATGIDKKLILGHVNKGKNAIPSTLATYATAFTDKLGRSVTVAELLG